MVSEQLEEMEEIEEVEQVEEVEPQYFASELVSQSEAICGLQPYKLQNIMQFYNKEATDAMTVEECKALVKQFMSTPV